MSVLRAVPPAESLSVHLVNSIASLCATHRIPRGNPLDLGAFLRALRENRHLAMEFWKAVARVSDESAGLALVAINGVVLEAVIGAVTGCSVAEMIAAGSEQRRLVGELGSLLAGEDADGPFAGPVVENVAVEPRPGVVDAERVDVENLRADVERLKAAFESRFGAESAKLAVQVPRPGPEAMAGPAAVSTQPTHEAPPAIPAQDDLPDQAAASSEAHAPSPRVAANHHFVYAEARALSRGERMDWVDQARAAAPVPAETVPFAPSSGEGAWVPEKPEFLEGAGRVPVVSVSEPAAATAASVFDGDSAARDRSRRRSRVLLLSAALLMLVAGSMAYLRYWPLLSPTATAARGQGGNGTVGVSAPRPAEVSTTSDSNGSVPGFNTPAPAFAAAHAPVRRVPEASSNEDESQIREGVVAASEPPKIKSIPNERILPPPVANISGPETKTSSEVIAALVNSAASPPAPQIRPVPVIERAPSTAAAVSAPKESLPAAPIVRAAASPAVDKTGAPQRMSSGVITAAKIFGYSPMYPLIAKASHVTGSVVLKAVISKTGSVEDVQVVSGPPILRRSAVEAVKTWRYKPSFLNGEPINVGTVIVVNFKEGS
jgi:periplasmic protein TonB